MRRSYVHLTSTAVVLQVTSLLVIAAGVAWVLIDDIRKREPVISATSQVVGPSGNCHEANRAWREPALSTRHKADGVRHRLECE
jgi:hypothetical protein